MSEELVQLGVPETRKSGRRLYMETYGCQMNVADSGLISSLLARSGYLATDNASEADVILINTCAVREKAAERVLARATELAAHKRRRPGVVLGVTGCMAEHLKEKLLDQAPFVDVIVGPDSYRRLADLINGTARAVDVTLDRLETYEGLDTIGDGVSGPIVVQRGCDKFCTFCIVPFTRGRERSVAPLEVLRQTRALAGKGYKEVLLLGQTVSSYRHGETDFARLLDLIAQVPGIERVRFTSPYPADFDDALIRAIATIPGVAKHVHLPLQSACDSVLERMKRGYTYSAFVGVVEKLRRWVPDIAITTDILVGFSGETEPDFQRTVKAMEELHFDAAFLFAYSERAGTLAAKKLGDDVPEAEKQRRLATVIHLQEGLSTEANARYVGRTERVLVHGAAKRGSDQLVGRTDTFKAVIIPAEGRAPGDVVDVLIERTTSATLFGKVV